MIISKFALGKQNIYIIPTSYLIEIMTISIEFQGHMSVVSTIFAPISKEKKKKEFS